MFIGVGLLASAVRKWIGFIIFLVIFSKFSAKCPPPLVTSRDVFVCRSNGRLSRHGDLAAPPGAESAAAPHASAPRWESGYRTGRTGSKSSGCKKISHPSLALPLPAEVRVSPRMSTNDNDDWDADFDEESAPEPKPLQV